MTNLKDRYRGALLGLAAGDALGTTVEFSSPGSFTPVADMVGGGPFGLPAGAWTDDTSMALCLAESLVECGGFDSRDQLERYVRWWRDGHLSSTGTCFDIGNATAASLRLFERTGDPWPGDSFPDAAGNGALMRLAPVALMWGEEPAEALDRATMNSRVTHGARESHDACRYFAGLIAGALEGCPKDELLGRGTFDPDGSLGSLHPEVERVAAGSFRNSEPPAINGGGYVINTLEAALWALWRSRDFRSGALAAVNLGDDADTTGAVYGQLAGALYGAGSIPPGWRRRLVMRDRIETLADRLLKLSHRWRPTDDRLPPDDPDADILDDLELQDEA